MLGLPATICKDILHHISSSRVRWAISIMIPILLISCSASSDEDFPGACELRCEGAVIAADSGRGIEFTPTRTQIDVQCVGTLGDGVVAELGGPVTVQMRMSRRETISYDNPFDANDDDSFSPELHQLAGVLFEPIITGAMAGARTNSENATITGEQVDPYRYAGIVTPKSQWCTDSCGIATVEVWPSCIGGKTNDVVVQFHSGSLYSTSPVQVKVIHESN